jgi:uncharacterized membrane protein
VSLLTPSEEQAVLLAIAAAEKCTSGEIRVHMEIFCFGDPFRRALKLFGQLNMQATQQRNGILIFIATGSKKLAIVGDEGIHACVGQPFWYELIEVLQRSFKKGDHATALVACIERCGQLLSKHFPVQDDDENELSNAISYG